MDQNFQTSFIPKKPLTPEAPVRSRSVSLLAILSIFILLAVVLSSGGVYLYKKSLETQIADKAKALQVARKRLESTQIDRLQELDKRLNSSTQILGNHIAVSNIFSALQENTLKSIRYTKFSYSMGDKPGANIYIKMSGQASGLLGYKSIALEADLFNKNKNIIDPIFSNLSLDNKGNVIFDLEFFVNPNFVNYKQILANNAPANAPASEIKQ